MAADTPIARHAGRRAAAGRAAPALAASAILASSSILALGCELTEVTVFEPEDVIIAESQVVLTLAPDYAADISMTALALLHRTNERDGSRRVMGATVRVSGESGATVQFVEQDSAAVCLVPREEVRTTVFGNDSTVVIRTVVPFNEASCYRAELSPSPFAPGERLSLEITAPDGRVITGASRTPGAFSFMGLAQEGGSCRLDPDTNYRFNWTPSENTWAYIADTRIEGLGPALAPQDIEAPDSLYLVGLAISREDTEIVFPRDFGVFDFFDGDDNDRDIIRALNEGLPGGAWASISLAATDRNWVNWARRGNFNPSGLVRIPSLVGDGTGVFGTAVQRLVSVTSGPDGVGELPLCGPAAP